MFLDSVNAILSLEIKGCPLALSDRERELSGEQTFCQT